MDGINGITGWYSLAILIPLILTERGQANQNLMIWISISLMVFNYFNSRLKARCFAGDVGSVGIALLLIYFVLNRMLFSDQWQLIFLFTLYGIDAVFTIIQRIYERENIFDAHRKHLYQYLANEMKWSHLTVAGLYFCLQIFINSFLVFFEPSIWIIGFMVLILAVAYIFVKRWIYVHKIRPKF
jgi:UDP-N-acetylmuramyl pentapeptide phosphotransferase/UDP-N-acetylglucosamine-1-phosphate transferase